MYVIMLLLACIHVTMLLLAYMHITILLLAGVGPFLFQTDLLSLSIFKQGGFYIIMKKMVHQILWRTP